MTSVKFWQPFRPQVRLHEWPYWSSPCQIGFIAGRHVSRNPQWIIRGGKIRTIIPKSSFFNYLLILPVGDHSRRHSVSRIVGNDVSTTVLHALKAYSNKTENTCRLTSKNYDKTPRNCVRAIIQHPQQLAFVPPHKKNKNTPFRTKYTVAITTTATGLCE